MVIFDVMQPVMVMLQYVSLMASLQPLINWKTATHSTDETNEPHLNAFLLNSSTLHAKWAWLGLITTYNLRFSGDTCNMHIPLLVKLNSK